MRLVIPLILILLFIIPQNCAEPIYIKQVSPETKTICQVYGTWKLSFEITNTNPYTVFVAIPDYIKFSDKSLKYSEDFQKLDVKGEVATRIDKGDYTILNGEKGIWIPPYTTVRVYKYGNFSYILKAPILKNRFKVIGPALVDTTKVFDESQIKSLCKYGVKVSNYRLLVDGKINISNNTEVLSIVIPAPLVLKDYDSFHKLLGRYDVDIWVDSYRDYVNKHKTMASKRYFELYNSVDDTLVPVVDDTLIPIGDNYLRDEVTNLKSFDIPAMVFTTTIDDKEKEIKPLEFFYVMYKY